VSEHERIFLEPAPGADEEYGRQWCQHGVWEDGVEYVRADIAEDEITNLSKELAEARAQNEHSCGYAEMGSYSGQVVLMPPDWLRAKWPNGIGIDVCLALEIQKLWRDGIRTNGHCCGHGSVSSYIGVSPESRKAMIDAGYVEISGVDCAFFPKTVLRPPTRKAKGETV
jgi:hypothetical protein